MSEEEERVREVFQQVLEADPARRAELLERLTRGRTDVREPVRVLLGAFERAGNFLADPTFDEAGTGPMPTGGVAPSGGVLEGPGTVVGRYKLLQQIGEGGFGVVFMAEQQEPVRRNVALKVIKLGMDTRQVVARFEAERQALAMMDHPNIAKVFDAGATGAGRPYFVMELVHGVSITTYCDGQKLRTRQRLELFAEVCSAVQHAHQKGVIHRDIKPGNVLVAEQDGRAVPKVIDFGIAKATDRRLTERTLFTEFRQMVGTPVYMSPEQAVGGGSNVDTRTDVYGLGVLLYELLTGTTPFEEETLRGRAYEEMQRIIRDVEPDRPSTRLAGLGARSEAITAARGTSVQKLGGLLRGELDWVVMKCLEKDRARRYESAGELAADLRRYLAGEPVLARPSTAAYRFRKFARRHRPLVAAGAVAVVSLAAVVVALSVGIHLVGRERDRAEGLVIERDRIAAKDRKDRQVADEAARLAEQRLAENLVYAADGLANTGRHREARETYEEALDLARQTGVPEMPARSGLVALSINSPMPLVGSNASDSAGGFTSEKVHGLDVSADGRRVVTLEGGAHDKGQAAALVFDVRTGCEVGRYASTNGRVLAAGFSADGDRVLTVDARGATEWELPGGRAVRSWKMPPGAAPVREEDPYAAVVILPGARRLLVKAGSLCLWNLDEPQTATPLDDRVLSRQGAWKAPTRFLSFGPDRRTFLTCTDAQFVTVWETATLKPVRRDVESFGWSGYPCLLRGDRTVVDCELRQHVLGAGEAEGGPDLFLDREAMLGDVGPMYCGTENWPFICAGRRDIAVIDPRYPGDRGTPFGYAQGNVIEGPLRIIAGQGECNALAMLNGGRGMFAAGDGLSLHAMSDEGTNAEKIFLQRRFRCRSFSPDGRLLAAFSSCGPSDAQGMVVWDVATWRRVLELPPLDGERVDWSPDGRTLFAFDDGVGYLVGLEEGRVIRRLDLARFQDAWLVDASTVLAEIDGDHSPSGLFLVDVATGRQTPCPEVVAPEEQSELLDVPTISAAKGLIAFARGIQVRLWDWRNGSIRTLSLPKTPERSRSYVGLTFVADGERLVAETGERVLTVDVSSLAITHDVAELTEGNVAAVLPGGRYAVNLPYYEEHPSLRAIVLWDLWTGKEVRRMPSFWHPEWPLLVAPKDRGILCTGVANRYFDFTRPDEYRRFRAELPAARAKLRQNPEDAQALLTLGRWYAFRGMNDWAIEFFRHAERNGATPSHLDMARCCWLTHRNADAVKEFERAAEKGEASPTYLKVCANGVGRVSARGAGATAPH